MQKKGKMNLKMKDLTRFEKFLIADFFRQITQLDLFNFEKSENCGLILLSISL